MTQPTSPTRTGQESADTRALPDGWHNHEGYRAIFAAALSGICANPAYFGPLFQQSPSAAVEFAESVLRAAIAKTEGLSCAF